jgi:hypothetical protein
VRTLNRDPQIAVRWEPLGPSTWSTVATDGAIRCDTRTASTDEWMWVIAHQLCHLGMGHLTAGRCVERDGTIDPRWNTACCVEVDRFLDHFEIGRSPLLLPRLPPGDAESLAALAQHCPSGIRSRSLRGR